MESLPLFVRDDVDLSQIKKPTLTESEANLHFHQWIQHDPPFGNRMFSDDDDWVPLYFSEIIFPTGEKFSVSNPGSHRVSDVGEVVQQFRLGGLCIRKLLCG